MRVPTAVSLIPEAWWVTPACDGLCRGGLAGVGHLEGLESLGEGRGSSSFFFAHRCLHLVLDSVPQVDCGFRGKDGFPGTSGFHCGPQ